MSGGSKIWTGDRAREGKGVPIGGGLLIRQAPRRLIDMQGYRWVPEEEGRQPVMCLITSRFDRQPHKGATVGRCAIPNLYRIVSSLKVDQWKLWLRGTQEGVQGWF